MKSDFLKTLVIGLLGVIVCEVSAACPDLTGDYVCTNDRSPGVVDYAISQSVTADGTTVYTSRGSEDGLLTEWIADGKNRPHQETGSGYTLNYLTQSLCVREKLVVNSEGKMTTNGYESPYLAKITLFKVGPKYLVVEQETQFDTTYVCTAR